jgi:hypothetical protein
VNSHSGQTWEGAAPRWGILMVLLCVLASCDSGSRSPAASSPPSTGASTSPDVDLPDRPDDSAGWTTRTLAKHGFSIGLPPGWKVVRNRGSTLSAFDSGFPDATVQMLALSGAAEPSKLAAATKRNAIAQFGAEGPFLMRSVELSSGTTEVVSFRTSEDDRGMVENEVYHLSGSEASLIIFFKGPPPLTPLLRERFAEIAETVRFL